MVKVFKSSSPLALFLGFAVLTAFLFVGLPLLLVAIAVFTLLSIIKRFFGFRNESGKSSSSDNYTFRKNTPTEDPYVSPIIHNNKIGTYRVIENPNDPDVIEVEKL